MKRKGASLVVFNWKENPRTLREAVQLAAVVDHQARQKGRRGPEIVVCPPLIYLAEISRKIGGTGGPCSLGVQNIFWENGGAYTGETGPAMVAAVGGKVKYAIVGHSERRRYLAETDEMINRKAYAALAAGLRAILCVGEPPKVRKKGVSAVKKYVKNQLKKDLRNFRRLPLAARRSLIIAYEPIWAIGTGRNCPPMEALAMARLIQQEASHILYRSPSANDQVPVLYGGSVEGANVMDYLCYNEIKGVLVGGSSLRAAEIRKIFKKTS